MENNERLKRNSDAFKTLSKLKLVLESLEVTSISDEEKMKIVKSIINE